jgi:3-hydroxypropanoate dehydrogenase
MAQNPISDSAIDQLFRTARTQNKWTDQPVSDETLKKLYEIFIMGPTTANTLPARVIFVRSEKTMSAPVCAIIGYDVEFWRSMDKTFPHNPEAPTWFNWSEDWSRQNAARNGSLQGAYFMLAARALGIDVGAMSGFELEGVNKEFFAGTTIEANFLCNLGHGDPAGVMERLPRLSFDAVCTLA